MPDALTTLRKTLYPTPDPGSTPGTSTFEMNQELQRAREKFEKMAGRTMTDAEVEDMALQYQLAYRPRGDSAQAKDAVEAWVSFAGKAAAAEGKRARELKEAQAKQEALKKDLLGSMDPTDPATASFLKNVVQPLQQQFGSTLTSESTDVLQKIKEQLAGRGFTSSGEAGIEQGKFAQQLIREIANANQNIQNQQLRERTNAIQRAGELGLPLEMASLNQAAQEAGRTSIAQSEEEARARLLALLQPPPKTFFQEALPVVGNALGIFAGLPLAGAGLKMVTDFLGGKPSAPAPDGTSPSVGFQPTGQLSGLGALPPDPLAYSQYLQKLGRGTRPSYDFNRIFGGGIF